MCGCDNVQWIDQGSTASITYFIVSLRSFVSYLRDPRVRTEARVLAADNAIAVRIAAFAMFK